MQYYSTEHKAPAASLAKAVVQGLAEDRGLYMPERIPALPEDWFRRLPELSFVEIGQEVAAAFFGEDVPRADLDRIVAETLAFDYPAVPVEEGIIMVCFKGLRISGQRNPKSKIRSIHV